MNLGIVIGVSEYQKVSPLPGCVVDANSINKLLELSNKCDDILFITENTQSKDVKSRLASFVKKYEQQDINEVIFYFSGHGLFEDDEFYYVLTDYTESKTKQTSLENSELDNLLRSLSAKLTVKVVDACQAGTRYIKDPDVFRKYLQQSEQGFDKCYFFFSSQNNQSSYQSAIISDFTLSFLNAFIERPNQEVRYKDVMDTLADEFTSNTKQTPYFVMQGNYTETFGYIALDVAKALDEITKGSTGEDDKSAEDSHKSLVQLIQGEAGLYCSKEEAVDAARVIENHIVDFKFNEEINELFNLKIQNEIDSNIPVNTEYVGKSLSNSNHDYMVDIHCEDKVRKVPKHKGLAGLSALLDSIPMVDEYYSVAVGATSIVELPYKFMSIRLQAKYPNVNDSGCVVIPFVSQTKIVIYSAFYHFRTREWDVKSIDMSTLEWSSFDEYIKKESELANACLSLLVEFQNFSLRPLQKRFELIEVDGENDS
jgi:uncharacterized caspase-like protein